MTALTSALGPQMESALESISFTLRLLGGFDLSLNGRPVRIPDGSQSVIAFLALQTAPVRRNFVAGSLWSGRGDERAAANLRSALWRLRPDGSGLVVATGTALSLADNVSVDHHDTLRVAAGVIRGDPEIETQPAWEVLSRVADFLPGWYDDWVVTERERLSQTRLRALEVLGRRALEHGQIEQAIGLAQSVLLAEPLRETGHLLLAKAHLANGNRADALRQIRRLDSLLRAELGISASPEAWRIADLARTEFDRPSVVLPLDNTA